MKFFVGTKFFCVQMITLHQVICTCWFTYATGTTAEV